MAVPDILKILGFSSQFFQMPFFILNLLSAALFLIAMKSILKKIGIFKSAGVNYGIAAVITFFTLPFLSGISSLAGGASLFIICLLDIRGAKGFLIGTALAAIFVLFLTPFILGLPKV